MDDDVFTNIIIGVLVVLGIGFYVWLYHLGGPCSGTITEVPVWCL